MLKMIAAAAFLSAALPGIAPAQEFLPDIHVSYHDLDLRSADGVKTLDRRLRKAIEAVCPSAESADRWTRIAASRCQDAKRIEIAALRGAALAKAAAAGTQVASAH